MKIKYLIFPSGLQLFLRLLLRPIAFFFLRYRVDGLENIKKIKGNCIIASNHIAEMDSGLIPIILPIMFFPGPIFFVSMSKEAYLDKGWRGRLFYGGWLFHLLGAREVYRGLEDYSLSVRNHIRLLEEKQSILIFPEGRFSRDGKMGTAGGGVAYLSHKTKTPIMPVRLEGILGIDPSQFFKRQRKLVVKIGRPIFCDDLFPENFVESRDNFRQKADELMTIISKL